MTLKGILFIFSIPIILYFLFKIKTIRKERDNGITDDQLLDLRYNLSSTSVLSNKETSSPIKKSSILISQIEKSIETFEKYKQNNINIQITCTNCPETTQFNQILFSVLDPSWNGLEYSCTKISILHKLHLKTLLSIESDVDRLYEYCKDLYWYARPTYKGDKEFFYETMYYRQYVLIPLIVPAGKDVDLRLREASGNKFDYVYLSKYAVPQCVNVAVYVVKQDAGVLVIEEPERRDFKELVLKIPKRWKRFDFFNGKIQTSLWVTR